MNAVRLTVRMAALPFIALYLTGGMSSAGPQNETTLPQTTSGKVVVIDADGKRFEGGIRLQPGISGGKLIIMRVRRDGQQDDPAEPSQQPDSQLPEQPLLEQPENVERPMIGVHCVEADELLRSHIKLGSLGLVVKDVVAESPAATAGIMKNDLLLRAGDQELATVQDLMTSVLNAGEQEITLHLLRSGEPQSINVTPRMMREPREVTVVLSESEFPQFDGLHWQEMDSAGQKAIEQLQRQRMPLRLRQFSPGIMIDKSSSAEDIQRLIEEAMNAARAALPESPAPSPTAPASLQEQLQKIQQELKAIAERLSTLEQAR